MLEIEIPRANTTKTTHTTLAKTSQPPAKGVSALLFRSRLTVVCVGACLSSLCACSIHRSGFQTQRCLQRVPGEGLALHTIILPYIRLESVTKWRIAMALRDDVLLKEIQLMSRIDALGGYGSQCAPPYSNVQIF